MQRTGRMAVKVTAKDCTRHVPDVQIKNKLFCTIDKHLCTAKPTFRQHQSAVEQQFEESTDTGASLTGS